MLNTTDSQRSGQDLDLSKFWAFRLINFFSVISLFGILAILLIPIPYLNRHRSPSVIELNFNNNAYSHAIKISTNKLPGNVLSVTFTTYNSDHIIGKTTFGDVILHRDGDYIARFISAHYHDKRKGLPFGLVVVDAYPDRFVVKKFTMRPNAETSYVPTEAWVYVMPSASHPLPLDVSLTDLINSRRLNIYKTFYEDVDGRIVTQYQAGYSYTIGTLETFGKHIVFGHNALYRTVTTVSFKPFNILKVVVTTFYSQTSEPEYKVLYLSPEHELAFDNIADLSVHLDTPFQDKVFEVERYDPQKITTVDYSSNSSKNTGVVVFDLNHEHYKFDIVISDHRDAVVRVDIPSVEQPVLTSNTLDRLLVLVYDTVEPLPPKYYLFIRTMYYSNTVVFNQA